MTSNNLNQSVITDHFADIGTMIEFGSGSLFVHVNKKVESGLVSLEKKAIKNPDGLEE